MADVVINKFTTQILRDGATPSSPGFVVSEGQDPVNPPGTNNFVPYSGAISNVELGEYGLESGFITLDTTPTGTPVDQGTIYWDDSKSTAALIMNGTTQHIGQDTYFYVKNSTGSNIAKGVAVRFDGTDGASGHLKIAPFLADGTYPSSYFMGVTAEAINNGEFGQVTNFGEIEGIDTSIYAAGDLLYASTTSAGAFQTTAPVAPNNIVLIAAAVNSKNNGAIIVRPTYGSNINDDEGVKIVSPTTGDLLQLQAGGLWENKTKAQVLGGTSSQFVKGDGSLDSTSYQPLLTNPVTGTGTTNYLPKFTGASTIGNSVIQEASSNIGIGVTPISKFDINVGASGARRFLVNYDDNLITIKGSNASGNGETLRIIADNIRFNTGSSGSGTERMRLDLSGNLGLGVTPSAWSGGFLGFDIGGSSASVISSSSRNIIASNVFYNGASYIYKNNDFALMHWLDRPTGQYRWYTAPSGTAGNPISFTQAMTLFSTGNLGIGVGGTDSGYKLDVNGTGRFSGNLYINDNSIFGLRTSGNEYSIQYRDLDFRLIGSSDSGTQRLFSFGYYTSNNIAGTWNSKATINSYTGAATFSSSVGVGGSISGNYPLTIRSSAADYTKILDWGTSVGGSWGTMSINVAAPYNTIFNSGGFAFTGGNVGIGTSSPSTYDAALIGSSHRFFNVQSTSNTYAVATLAGNQSSANDRIGYLTFVNDNNSSGYKYSAWIGSEVEGATANQLGGRLIFSTTGNASTAGPIERIRITSDGYARLSSSSGGIQFNGDTAAANALDDYEEGTWTPTITGGYTGITYFFQNGWYRKIGSAVIVSGRVNFSGTANGAGITMACPFTQGPTGYGSGGIPFSNIAVITNTQPYITGGSNSVLFYTTGTGVQIGSSGNVVDKWISFVITMSV